MQSKNTIRFPPTSFSFELFPPKTPEGYVKLQETIRQMVELKPDFFSCTYGAGGGSRGKTLDIVESIQNTHQIPAVAHLTCVLHTKDEIKAILEEMKHRSIANVLALRGDPPRENPGWQAGPDNFIYSSDLVKFIREHFGTYFGIGVAGFPEGHLLSPDREFDAQILKGKIDAGADFVMLGGLLAGTHETPGEVIERVGPDGKKTKIKVFRGMASKEAQEDFMGHMSEWKTAEGVSVEVVCRGSARDVIQDIMGGIRSGLTYCGAATIKDLQRKAQFMEITNAGKVEGTPHAIGRLTVDG